MLLSVIGSFMRSFRIVSRHTLIGSVDKAHAAVCLASDLAQGRVVRRKPAHDHVAEFLVSKAKLTCSTI